MRLYRLTYLAADLGTTQEWYGSKRVALDKKRVLGDAYGTATIEAVDVPTKKAFLLAWLNAYAGVAR